MRGGRGMYMQIAMESLAKLTHVNTNTRMLCFIELTYCTVPGNTLTPSPTDPNIRTDLLTTPARWMDTWALLIHDHSVDCSID